VDTFFRTLFLILIGVGFSKMPEFSVGYGDLAGSWSMTLFEKTQKSGTHKLFFQKANPDVAA